MLKNAIEKFIRKSKNPDFRFDEGVDGGLLLEFSWAKMISLLRGFKLIFRGRIPRNLFLERGVRFFNLKNIKLGTNIIIGERCLLEAIGKNPLIIGDNFRLGAFSRLSISMTLNNLGEGIKIGPNVSIGEYSYIGGAGGVEIGRDTIVGQYFSIHPENHVFDDISIPIRLQGVRRQGVVVGENCWIGAKVSIMDGVKIGQGCIIAAGAVVTKSFPDNVVIGGVPAKIIKERT